MSASLVHLFDVLLKFNQKFWHGSGDTSCRASWVELPPDFTLLLRQSIACRAIFTCAVRISMVGQHTYVDVKFSCLKTFKLRAESALRRHIQTQTEITLYPAINTQS
jgi:hypothetical protein